MKYVFGAVFSLWAIALALNLHGFSLSFWQGYLGNSGFSPLIGQAQAVRSDDWMVLQPLALSQARAVPSFPVINPLHGVGMNMLVVVTAPVKNQVTLFRPHTWGYFIGQDFGISWCWNFYVFSFLFSFFLLFMLCTERDIWVSALGSLALLFSPFFQFWALNSAALAAEGAMSTVLAIQLISSRSKTRVILLGLALGYTLTAFAYWIYPAFQIPLAYLGAAIFIGYLVRERRKGAQLHWDLAHGVAVALAILIPIISLSFFFHDAKDAIHGMYNTIYPGRRFSSGGGYWPWSFFANNLVPLNWVKTFADSSNICEWGSSVLVYPIILFLIFKNHKWKINEIDPVILAVSIVMTALTLWAFVPLPKFLAQITLFSRVPPGRSVIGTDIGNITLFVMFSALYFKKLQWNSQLLRSAAWVAIGWTLVMLAIFPWARQISPLPEPGPYRTLLWLTYAFVTSFSISFALELKFRFSILTILVAHLFVTLSFNPVVRKGSKIFEENDLAHAIAAVHSPQGARWLTLGDSVMPAFLHTLGIKTINGLHFYPQESLWKILDPQGTSQDAYNRYSFVSFFSSKNPKDKMKIIAPQLDVTTVEISPQDPAFDKLGADYLLSRGKLTGIDPKFAYEQVAETGPYVIYKKR